MGKTKKVGCRKKLYFVEANEEKIKAVI